METLETRQLLSLTIDLRLPGGAKTAEVSSVGQTLTMQVWAVVQGQDASGSNDGLWDAVGSFLSSGVGATALGGDLSATLQAPFNGVVAQAGTVQDLNGDGHLDVGSNNNSISTDFFIAYAASPQFGGTVSGATNSFLIGTLTYTVTSLGAGSTRIKFRPRTESARNGSRMETKSTRVRARLMSPGRLLPSAISPLHRLPSIRKVSLASPAPAGTTPSW